MAAAGALVGDAPGEDRGGLGAGGDGVGAGAGEGLDGVAAVGFDEEQFGLEGGPGGGAGDPWEGFFDASFKAAQTDVAGDVGGKEAERVVVAGDGGPELEGRVVRVAELGGGREGGFVAGQDNFEDVGRGRRVDGFWVDCGVGVAVADDDEVGGVVVPAAGEHGVGLLAGFGAGEQAVDGVGGDPLGGVDGRGVPEVDLLSDIVGGQGDVPSGLSVPGLEAAAQGGAGDGPPVAVLDPVVGCDPQEPVVLPGDDRVADAGPVPVSQLHLFAGDMAVEALVSGALVEFSDAFAGAGEHDRVAALVAVGGPGVEQVVGHGGFVADVDAVLVEVEAEGGGLSFA